VPYWWEPYVRAFIGGAQQLIAATGAQPTSYIRSVGHNEAVGGAVKSQHLLGTALDLVPAPGHSWSELQHAARAIGFGAVIDEKDHIHVQLFAAGQIPQWVYDELVGPGAPVGI